jgi:hypothetical protein
MNQLERTNHYLQSTLPSGISGLEVNLSKASIRLLEKMTAEEIEIYTNFQRRMQESSTKKQQLCFRDEQFKNE